MRQELKQKMLQIMNDHRIMTLATVRPDGYPQATTVGFAHDGLNLYFICGSASQKAQNIKLNPKVSVTIDADHEHFFEIEGLSLGGIASEITDSREINKIYEMVAGRYPEIMTMPAPDAADFKAFRIEPEVISVLDYSKGFGHTDLVNIKTGS